MEKISKDRKDKRGACIQDEIQEVRLSTLEWRDQLGNPRKLGHYKALYAAGARTDKDVQSIKEGAKGGVIFMPATQQLPMTSATAHMFRDFCLDLLVNFPELAKRWQEADLLRVHHTAADSNHLFEVTQDPVQVNHTWAMTTQEVQWDRTTTSVQQAVADVIDVEEKEVWVSPHSWLTRTKTVWAGRRRWRQTRQGYKQLFRHKESKQEELVREKLRQDWKADSRTIAGALEDLPWKRIHRAEGVTAYPAQNLLRLKLHRLRVWTGEEHKFGCIHSEGRRLDKEGCAHLVWECPAAEAHWDVLLHYWVREVQDRTAKAKRRKELMKDLISGKLTRLPTWLTQWGEGTTIEDWDHIYEVANDLWAMGCATVITAIWRFAVDKVHPDGRPKTSLRDAEGGLRVCLKELTSRYQMELYPITAKTVDKLQVVNMLASRWREGGSNTMEMRRETQTRVGFFDGGSRGNPGPGGGGSVILEYDRKGRRWEPMWAAATALGHQNTTNNVAEFVGLHRALHKAVEQGWKGIHIVGDSQLILTMMKARRAPRSKKLRHWYRITRKLADICEVRSWTHHYRANNKMADALANYAMDNKKSSTMGAQRHHRLREVIRPVLAGDIQQWETQHEQTREWEKSADDGSTRPRGTTGGSRVGGGSTR